MTQAPPETGAIIGAIQTDTFCEGCGYNLHAQAVARDERLGILIVRCPECGRYDAVGQTTTAARAWLNRLATILLAGWVFFVLLIFALCSFFMGLLAYGHMMEMTQIQVVSTPVMTKTATGTTYTGQYKYEYKIRIIPPWDREQQADQFREQFWLATLTIALSLITGAMFAAFLWHCKGPSRVLAFLPPIVSCGISAMTWASSPRALHIRDWGLAQIGAYLLIDLAGIAMGLWLGRRFARGLLRVLVPPKALQHLAFLWIVDGKTLKME